MGITMTSQEIEDNAALMQNILDKNASLREEISRLKEQREKDIRRIQYVEEIIKAVKSHYQEIIVNLCKRLLTEVE
jgi:translation initiation factor RLI1